MKKKFIGPVNPAAGVEDAGHDVVIAGRSYGTVRRGDVLDVPDDVARSVAWPESLWETPVGAKKKSEGES